MIVVIKLEKILETENVNSCYQGLFSISGYQNT